MRSNRIASLAAALLAFAVAHPGHSEAGGRGETRAQARAIAFARAQLGRPYLWGGTGPGAFDCSGLVWQAYGRRIPRTSQDQWAGLHHVPASQREPGDMVFAPGSDGTWAEPGHVGLFIGHGKVIQAYAPGTPIEVSTLAEFSSGAGGIVGYARP